MRDIALRLETKEVVGSTEPDENRLLFEVTAHAAASRNRLFIPQHVNLPFPVLNADRISKHHAAQPCNGKLYTASLGRAQEVMNKSGILVIRQAELDTIPEATAGLVTANERLRVATFVGVEAVAIALECFDQIDLPQAHFIGRVAGSALAVLNKPHDALV